MQKASFYSIYFVLAVLTGAIIPVSAQTPPDVHVCGCEPATFDQSYYSVGRPERHQRTHPAAIDDTADGVSGKFSSEEISTRQYVSEVAFMANLCKVGAARSSEVQRLLKSMLRQSQQKKSSELLDVLIPNAVMDEVTGVTHCFVKQEFDNKKICRLCKSKPKEGLWSSILIELRRNSEQVCQSYRNYNRNIRSCQHYRKMIGCLEGVIQKVDSPESRQRIEIDIKNEKQNLEKATTESIRGRQQLICLVGAETVDKVDTQLQNPVLTKLPIRK